MKKKVTINQVAEQAGVSKTTISRYLNGHYGNMSHETKERVAAVIKALNYRPNRQAQALKSKRSYLIGVVVADISNMYSSLLLKGIGEVLGEQGYQMIIMDAANSVEQEHDLLEKLMDQSVEAIILQPSSRDSRHYEFLKERNIPLLLVDRQTSPVLWPAVITDNVSAINKIMKVIIKENYQKIVVVSEPLHEATTREIRYETVKTLADEAGMETELLETTLEDKLDQRIRRQIMQPKKTMLFASNGRVLMALLTFLVEEKIDIPKAVGVTGFDDWNLTALVGPGITSIEQQSQTIGQTAAEQILQLLQDEESVADEIIVPTKLCWRKSI
ncbi:LacI family DNA-binding transcriptional regulator [Candidatus Enterococcus ferrettii]|uniref:LacI family transcriptional regulator, kdg operon repressor n=1 Tax=Candidatus Enterococcus ferrettii TaxID=2815324 RepID=A0ABV0ES28_9ENTE|nr:LacI family DNA-binding transcriptional regulator [Enterococcus sp. 665A]MBO1340410.1 LacI family DNA-binding transcriptional regulator [Enterococcus sp. 665A]